uniref:Uncharacterized protein n=1 Tax=Timema poppense TaxID=170557 RepID=A0A7R9DBE1_TIMPO|nr:unnamed protein product [Timema poppensis]
MALCSRERKKGSSRVRLVARILHIFHYCAHLLEGGGRLPGRGGVNPDDESLIENRRRMLVVTLKVSWKSSAIILSSAPNLIQSRLPGVRRHGALGRPAGPGAGAGDCGIGLEFEEHNTISGSGGGDTWLRPGPPRASS